MPERTQDPRPAAIACRRPLRRDRGRRRDARRGRLTGKSGGPVRAAALVRRPARGPAAGTGRPARCSAARPIAARRCSSTCSAACVDWLTTRGLLYRPRDLEALLPLARSARAGDPARRRDAGRGTAAARRSAPRGGAGARAAERGHASWLTRRPAVRIAEHGAATAGHVPPWLPSRSPIGPASRADAPGQSARAA